MLLGLEEGRDFVKILGRGGSCKSGGGGGGGIRGVGFGGGFKRRGGGGNRGRVWCGIVLCSKESCRRLFLGC